MSRISLILFSENFPEISSIFPEVVSFYFILKYPKILTLLAENVKEIGEKLENSEKKNSEVLRKFLGNFTLKWREESVENMWNFKINFDNV